MVLAWLSHVFKQYPSYIHSQSIKSSHDLNIQANIHNSFRNAPSQSPALRDPSQLAEITTPLHDQNKATATEHGPMAPTEMTSENAVQTVLIVSASDEVDRAPSYVYLKEYWSLADLFESLLDDRKVRGQAPKIAFAIKAMFLWSNRVQLLRRDTPDDWNVFWEALRWAWKHQKAQFEESGCEVEMILLVEEDA